jgi:hypothetical protein
MPASSGSGIEVRSGEKGACRSIAKLPPLGVGPRDERPNRGENVVRRKRRPRARFLGGERHPDCRDDAPLRGGRRDGDLGRPACGGHSNPPTTMSPRRPGGARQANGGGESRHALATPVAEGGRVPSLRGRRPTTARSTLFRPSSARPTVGSRRRLARDAARDGVHGRSTSRQLAADRETASLVQSGSLPAFSSEGERAIARCVVRKECAGSGGQRFATGGNAPRAGASEDRTLEVVLARRSDVAEVVRRCSGAEKRTLSISPDLEASGDGRLARGTTCASARAASEGTPAPRRTRKLT